VFLTHPTLLPKNVVGSCCLCKIAKLDPVRRSSTVALEKRVRARALAGYILSFLSFGLELNYNLLQW